MSALLNDKTRVTLSLLIVICGGVATLTTMYDQGKANAALIEEYKKELHSINKRLIRIEGKLNVGGDETHE